MVKPRVGFRQPKPVFCDLSENLGAGTSDALRVGEFVGQAPIQQIENLLFLDVEFLSFAQSSPASVNTVWYETQRLQPTADTARETLQSPNLSLSLARA
jgi:hypothetical protein